MLPFLTYPLALIGLVTLPALAAIYMLRNKFRRRKVSSLILWKLQERPKEGGVKVQRAQLPWIFFLELLILALLVIAATGPRWQFGRNLRPLLIVLDDSVSMTAKTPKGSPREQGLARIEKLLRDQKFQSVRIVQAAARPKLLGAPVRNLNDLRPLLDGWECRSASADLDTAIGFASELSHEGALLLVITDHAAPEALANTERLRWWSFGLPAPNAGFVNAARSPADDKDRVLIEVENFSTNAFSTELRIVTETSLLRKSQLDLKGRERRRLVLNLPARSPAIRALLGEDSLAADNEVHLIPPTRKRVRVQVSLKDSSLQDLVDRTLEITGLRSSLKTAPELIIHDQLAVPGGTNNWSLQIHSSEDAKPFSGPFVVDTSHPLADGLSLEGVIWSALESEPTPGYLPIITAGSQSLLDVRRDVLGRQQIRLNLSPQLSTVSQTPNWPALMWNLLEWRRSELPGLQEVNFRPGTEVTIQTQGDSLTLTRPGGETEAMTVGGGQIIARSEETGLYRVQASEGVWEFSVNLLSVAESDLRPNRTGTWGKWETAGEERRQYASMLWLFVLLALGALVSHLYFITSGKGRL
jgi:hypothetical protein